MRAKQVLKATRHFAVFLLYFWRVTLYNFTMIIISEDKWDYIKVNLLDKLEEDKVGTEPLFRFNYDTNQEEKIGMRETHEFTKNGMDFLLVLDKEAKATQNEEHFSGGIEYIFKMTIKFRDVDGSWKDSSAMEKRYEGEE